ncbi:fimbrial protein [Serratia proteamaculans]|uniref:fimbrial protein n=1 Tax=Serratia TaxID=613 RepID=UPI000BFFC709|nr:MULTISPECIES: fimbrial protein [Serratia]CAI1920164.1 Minor fimbrial protein prsF precursor [Serratia proteamaculans]CAI2430707.1 Minor fimbrial protein prsF precursor [Serratia proteamaculans]
MKSRHYISLVLLLGGIPMQVAGNTLFYGTLNEPPACTINNGGQIDVDFGARVGVNKVDGQNYIQTVNYRISCEPGVSGVTLGLKVIGSATGFDGAAVQTNLTDLGIRLLQNSQAFTLNKRMNIDAANPPILQAVPVKKPGAELKAGSFVVTATLLADYQ